ncbi:MAG TPA: PepSY-like domain-containing protein [Bacteroidia bacterium]|nr:PepSY-like domain-containing protein [Bacteroidia bacterium]
MKAIIFAAALLCTGATTVYAQKIKADKVPASVQTTFKKQFAQANKVEWEMEETDYEVNFKTAGVEYSAKYNKEGNWLETEQEIKKTDLPPAVKQAVDKEFPKAELEETEKVTLANNTVVYEMEIEQGKQKFEVQFSADGKLLKKETVTKKEGKD